MPSPWEPYLGLFISLSEIALISLILIVPLWFIALPLEVLREQRLLKSGKIKPQTLRAIEILLAVVFTLFGASYFYVLLVNPKSANDTQPWIFLLSIILAAACVLILIPFWIIASRKFIRQKEQIACISYPSKVVGAFYGAAILLIATGLIASLIWKHVKPQCQPAHSGSGITSLDC